MLFDLMTYPLLAQVPAEPEQIAQAFEVLDFGRISRALIVIVAAYAANHFLVTGLERLGEGQAKQRLLYKKISSFARISIFGLATYIVVMTVMEGKELMLVGFLATLGFALGFAFKDTASSLMAGVLILIDQPFQVGDRVTFGDIYGEVTEIGLRSVRIVTPLDDQISVPNNKFLTDAVASSNAGALDMLVSIDFHVGISADFDLAKRIIYEASITSRYVYLQKPAVVATQEVAYAGGIATRLRSLAYVLDTRHDIAYITDVTERVKRKFREHQITYPYSRRYAAERDFSEFPPKADGTSIARERAEKLPKEPVALSSVSE